MTLTVSQIMLTSRSWIIHKDLEVNQPENRIQSTVINPVKQ